MHIHDNMGDISKDYRHASDDRHFVPGEGCINWDKLLPVINNNYKGWFTFEIIPDEKLNNYSELLIELKNFIDKNKLKNKLI